LIPSPEVSVVVPWSCAVSLRFVVLMRDICSRNYSMWRVAHPPDLQSSLIGPVIGLNVPTVCKSVGSEVLTTVVTKSSTFWYITSCNVLEVNLRNVDWRLFVGWISKNYTALWRGMKIFICWYIMPLQSAENQQIMWCYIRV
jgi:hypothetical protein